MRVFYFFFGCLLEDASWNLFLESGQVSELQVTTKGIFIGITAAGVSSAHPKSRKGISS